MTETRFAPPLTKPTVKGVVDPACASRSHNTRWAWARTGCICRDPELYEAYMASDRRRHRIRVPSLRDADHLVAALIVDGYDMPAATKADRRMAAIMMRRRGSSLSEVAERLSLSAQTVLRWTEKTDHLKLRPAGRRPSLAQV